MRSESPFFLLFFFLPLTLLFSMSTYSFWCKPMILDVWSLDGLSEIKVKLRDKTSCALERYNRSLNDRFPNRHPNLLDFASGIYDEAKNWVQFVRNSTTSSIVIKDYETAKVKSLPLSYSRYQRKNDKMASPKRAFNKKKNAEHKKAAVERFVDELE